MMTLVGTTIYIKEGEGEDAVARSRFIMGEDIASLLFGSADSVTLSQATRWQCATKDTLCLYPERVALDDMNLTYEMWQAAKRYQRALLERNADLITDDDVLLLGSVSTVPLIRLINAATTRRYVGFSEDILRVYVEAAAFEAIIRALDQLTIDIQKAVSSSSSAQLNSLNEKHVRLIQARIESVREDLGTRADKIYQQMSRTNSFIEQVEHIERSLLGNAGHAVARRWDAGL